MTSPNPTAQEPFKPKLTLQDFTCRVEAFHAIRGFNNYGQFLGELGTMFDLGDLPVELLIELHVKAFAAPAPIPARAKLIIKLLIPFLDQLREPDDIEIAAHFIAPYYTEIAELLKSRIRQLAKVEGEQFLREVSPWLIYQSLYFTVMAGIAFNRRRTLLFMQAIQDRSKFE